MRVPSSQKSGLSSSTNGPEPASERASCTPPPEGDTARDPLRIGISARFVKQRACLGLQRVQQPLRFPCVFINLGDLLFAQTWGICFSLKANPNRLKNIAFWHTFGTGSPPARHRMLLRQGPSSILNGFGTAEKALRQLLQKPPAFFSKIASTPLRADFVGCGRHASDPCPFSTKGFRQLLFLPNFSSPVMVSYGLSHDAEVCRAF